LRRQKPMADGTTIQVEQGRRRIIERPRLTRLLDESPARIKMLVAPAGYGKTTLARQWIAGAKRRSSWIQCTSATADIAVLIARIAEGTSHLARQGQDRTLDRLRVTPDPARELSVFVDLITQDLADWPPEAWLVLDDYHEIMSSGHAEEFLDELLARTALNVVITSRRRPTWATAKRVFYGEVTEVGSGVLAMDDAETREALGGRTVPEHLIAAAEGWPAVISLAARNEFEMPEPAAHGAMYEFLASEIFLSLDIEAQRALLEIALVPSQHGSLLRHLHQPASAAAIHDEAVRVGILHESGDREGELHPLLQQFLLRRGSEVNATFIDRAVTRLLAILISEQRWDDAFAVLARAGRPQHLPLLLHQALDPLLEMGRVMSLRKWIDFALTHEIDDPIVKLTEAELAFRSGMLVRAEAIATEAAEGFDAFPDRSARSWCIAGQAAHLQNREEMAIEHFRRAAARAESSEVRHVAQWGLLVSSVDLELPDAENILRDVVTNEAYGPSGVVRKSHARLLYELRLGDLKSLREAAMAKQVVDRVRDPIRRVGFLGVYASALAINAQYHDALAAAMALLDDVENSRIDFALSYVYAVRAMALLGLRRQAEAVEAVRDARNAAEHTNDDHALANSIAIRGRILLSQAHYEEALECLSEPVSGPITRGMAGELLACQALALACLRDPAYARPAAAALAHTRSLEARVFVPLAHAIFKSLTNAGDLPQATRAAIDTAARSGGWDYFVCGYRAHPEFLLSLRGDAPRTSALAHVVRRVNDNEVLQAIGLARSNQRNQLSPRESEIQSLVAIGLTNREIASRLFISEATVKLHVHRVLDKLGVRTRTAAAAQYRASRSNTS
jgi:LuxR family transcriptional regulator, maltose regulon positive regulatory protein